MASKVVKQPLSIDDLDLLQEIMNIAFGRAAADLAGYINLFVKLSVPKIEIISTNEIQLLISNSDKLATNKINVVRQEFWGDFGGSAVLILPSATENELISIMGNSEVDVEFDEISTSLAEETMLELGNILIGACSGKIAELLKTTVTYSPPFAIMNTPIGSAIEQINLNDSAKILALKTSFSFEENNLCGLLLIAEREASFTWMKEALNKFLAQYE